MTYIILYTYISTKINITCMKSKPVNTNTSSQQQFPYNFVQSNILSCILQLHHKLRHLLPTYKRTGLSHRHPLRLVHMDLTETSCRMEAVYYVVLFLQQLD